MSAARLTGLSVLAGLLLWTLSHTGGVRPSAEPAPLVPAPTPCPSPLCPPEPPPTPKRPLRPWGPRDASVEAQAKVGGSVAPDGTEIQCDLPCDQHCHNVSSRGEGCCTQTSVNHSARWQNVPALIDFHKWVQEKGLPGGGYPERMAQRIPACAKDRGYPAPAFVQIENSKDLEPLRLACATGRMVAVTYSRSPTGRYGGQTVSHMVSMPHCDSKWVGILDNNYMPKDQSPGGVVDNIEWMTPDEFIRVCNPRGYWAVILLSPGPPSPPRN